MQIKITKDESKATAFVVAPCIMGFKFEDGDDIFELYREKKLFWFICNDIDAKEKFGSKTLEHTLFACMRAGMELAIEHPDLELGKDIDIITGHVIIQML